MENTLKLFAQLSDKAFATASRYFNANARALLVTRWQDYCANGTQRVYASGDIKAANKMYAAAVICGFRLAFQRAVVPQIPFKYEKGEGFTGKIQKGKRDALIALAADGVAPLWESDMRHRFDNENESKGSAKGFNVKRFATLVKDAHASGMTDAEIRKNLTAAIKDNPAVVAVPDSTVPNGEAQAHVIAAKKAA